MLVYASHEINRWIDQNFGEIDPMFRNEIEQYFDLWWEHSGSWNYAEIKTLEKYG